jgi:hypothetical protein
MKLCECGCGKAAPVAPCNNKSKGWVKGEPLRFVRGHNAWGARQTNHLGYVALWDPRHPRASIGNGNYVLEHVVVAERALGKRLPLDVEIHHVNEDKADNRRSNLVICQDHAYHMLIHARQRALRGCGDPSYRRCRHCREWDAPGLMIQIEKGKSSFAHRACRNRYKRQAYQQRRTA